jgi:hypothetical protein
MMACAKEYRKADVGYWQGETISQWSVVRKGSSEVGKLRGRVPDFDMVHC